MKQADLQLFRERLAAMRLRMVGDVNAMADAAFNPSGKEASGAVSRAPIHMADVGTDAYDQEFTIERIENEGEVLELIAGALSRVDAGSYGVCLQCQGKIPKARLNAIPYTPYCIRCAEENEG